MAKYDPLHTYLRRQKADVVTLSFREIENLIAGLLPKGATRSDWWGNEPMSPESRANQTTAWLKAGYLADLQAQDERVRFTRARSMGAPRAVTSRA